MFLPFHAQLPTAEPPVQEAHEVRRAPEHLQTSKEEVLNSDELAQRNREVGQQASPAPQVTEPIVREQPKIGRNDKVTSEYPQWRNQRNEVQTSHSFLRKRRMDDQTINLIF